MEEAQSFSSMSNQFQMSFKVYSDVTTHLSLMETETAPYTYTVVANNNQNNCVELRVFEHERCLVVDEWFAEGEMLQDLPHEYPWLLPATFIYHISPTFFIIHYKVESALLDADSGVMTMLPEIEEPCVFYENESRFENEVAWLKVP
jgi:hypothetical protein